MAKKLYAYRTVNGYARQVRRFWAGARQGRGTEALHQLRVSLRRLDNALNVFKEVLGPRDVRRWRRHISRLLKALGPARDGDIRLLFLAGERRRLHGRAEQRAWAQVTGRFSKRRRPAQAPVVKTMDGFQKKKMLEEIEAACPVPQGRGRVPAKGKVGKLARRTLRRRLKKFLRYEPLTLRPASMEELHRMRIAVRKLRYTLEMFDGVFGRRAASFLNAVKTLQGHLGKMHDYDGLLRELTDIVAAGEKSGGQQTVIARAGGRFQTLYDRTHDGFLRAWARYKNDGLWERLARLASRPEAKNGKRKV